MRNKLAFGRVHGGLEQFLGIHLAQALEAFDLQAAFADLLDRHQDLGDGEQRPTVIRSPSPSTNSKRGWSWAA
jgi:hypothetical protein